MNLFPEGPEGLHPDSVFSDAPPDAGFEWERDRFRAMFSTCRKFRYVLEIPIGDGPSGVFWMLNPSTADAQKLDATVARCLHRARGWGWGMLTVLNLFAVRATEPKNMKAADDPEGPLNDWAVRQVLRRKPKAVVAGWGADGAYRDRESWAERTALENGAALQCLGLTKYGHPRHPLYLKKTARLRSWSTPRSSGSLSTGSSPRSRTR